MAENVEVRHWWNGAWSKMGRRDIRVTAIGGDWYRIEMTSRHGDEGQWVQVRTIEAAERAAWDYVEQDVAELDEASPGHGTRWRDLSASQVARPGAGPTAAPDPAGPG